MKVRLRAKIKDSLYEQVVEIDESKIAGQGYLPRSRMKKILDNWVANVVESDYQIINDERFRDEVDNLPYVDLVTKKKLGWADK